MLGNFDYRDYRKQNDIHGSALYPAVMIAPVQEKLLLYIINKTKINSIIDPFHGSGTSLYEALKISNEIKLVGCDINPLANLIAKSKLEGVSKSIHTDFKMLKENISNNNSEEIHKFINSQKWFRKDIAIDLTKVRNSICTIKSKKNRLFFWTIMSNIIRRYSNTRSSTYKLHIKPKDKINSMENRVIEDYLYSVKKNIDLYNKHSKNYKLYKTDTLAKMKTFSSNEFDLLISSPPYGDNQTTVTYGQFSILSLFWIDKKDLELEGWELENYSKIDSNSMGGNMHDVYMKESDLNYILPYLKKISDNKQKKVISFFKDYFDFLSQACRITSKYVVLTLGNRTVDGIKINLTNITENYLEKLGFIKEQELSRKILYKRTPVNTSKVNNKSVPSMNKEYMIIYVKNNCA